MPTSRIIFKFLKAQFKVHYMINCNVKVLAAPLKLTYSLLLSSREKVQLLRTDLISFLWCIVSGAQKFLYPAGLFKIKLNRFGCLIPFTKPPSITSLFKWI